VSGKRGRGAARSARIENCRTFDRRTTDNRVVTTTIGETSRIVHANAPAHRVIAIAEETGARLGSQVSARVKIAGKEVMLKNKSYFKKSTGDEAGAAPKKGAITSQNRGKVYFNAWSMDVKIEGENVVRRHATVDLQRSKACPAGARTTRIASRFRSRLMAAACRDPSNGLSNERRQSPPTRAFSCCGTELPRHTILGREGSCPRSARGVHEVTATSSGLRRSQGGGRSAEPNIHCGRDDADMDIDTREVAAVGTTAFLTGGLGLRRSHGFCMLAASNSLVSPSLAGTNSCAPPDELYEPQSAPGSTVKGLTATGAWRSSMQACFA